MIGIPEVFVRNTVAREGRIGRKWIAALPGLVDGLLERWGCTPGAPVRHGQVGIVVPVRSADLPAAVLKVSFPHPGNVHEQAALAAWGGLGAVRLHCSDDARFAMLLERASTTTLADLPDVDQAVTAAGVLAARLAVPAPAGPTGLPGLPGLRDHALRWAREIGPDSAELGDPLPRRVTDCAAAAFREFGVDQPDTLVHGDLHFTNVLRAEREPWLAIDPKGLVGDPAYDGVTLLRSRCEDLVRATDPRAALLRRLAIFSDAAGLDRERSRRWAQARAVQAVLWGRRHADPPQVVRVAELIAELLV